MKPVILRQTFVFALVAFVLSAHAAVPLASVAPTFIAKNSMAMEHAVKHQINRYVVFPLGDEEEAMFGTVEIQFVVNTEGRLVVTAAHSENKDLCDYVVAKLHRVQVGPNPSGLWKTSHMRFNFRPE